MGDVGLAVGDVLAFGVTEGVVRQGDKGSAGEAVEECVEILPIGYRCPVLAVFL